VTLLPQKMARQSAAALAEVPIFAGLSKRHLEKVARIAVTKRYRQDAKMVIAGDRGESFFVVLEGTALVTAGDFIDVVLGPGDFFGEMALLDGYPRSATVTAESPVEVMIVTRRSFIKLLESEPTIAIAMLKTLTRRVRALSTAQ
jgi:CRP/FNR family cyclic AMP-dependent transcriptional regulator